MLTENTKQTGIFYTTTRLDGSGKTIYVASSGMAREYDFDTLELQGAGVGVFEKKDTDDFLKVAEDYKNSLLPQ